MTVLVDTSAFLAVLDSQDRFHARAGRILTRQIEQDEELICTSHILVESFALIQRRLGIAAVQAFAESLLPSVRIHWVTPGEHQAGVAALLAAGRRNLSLVDHVSFTVMRELGVADAFTFDQDFARQGFRLLD